MFSAGDQLLEVLATRGPLAWESFAKTLSHVAERIIRPEDEVRLFRYHTTRTLQALAYCDLGYRNGLRVFPAPIVLARLPRSGPPRAILTGTRATSDLDRFSKKLTGSARMMVRALSDNGFVQPTNVLVESDSLEDLERFAEESGLPFPKTPPAISVLNFASDLEEVIRNDLWIHANAPIAHQSFDIERLRFVRQEETHNHIKLIRTGGKFGTMTYLLDGSRLLEIDADWGRYALLSKAKRNVLTYYRKDFALAVPASVPLPRILERAVALCTGLPGIIREMNGSTNRMIVYKGISKDFAGGIAKKIQQELLVSESRLEN